MSSSLAPPPSPQSSSKRKRIDNTSSLWETMKHHIIINNNNGNNNNNGYIHNDITFNEVERTIQVINGCIKKGTIIMKIPTNRLITLSTVEKSYFGPILFRLLNGFMDNQKQRMDMNDKCHTSKTIQKEDKEDDRLYHSKNDLLLALFLSIMYNITEKGICIPNDSSIYYYDWIQTYLTILPSEESYNNLPRRWNNDELDILLSGTRLLHRTKEEQNGLINDYKLLYNKLKLEISSNDDNDVTIDRSDETLDHSSSQENLSSPSLSPEVLLRSSLFPSLRLLDQMLAAVESRAFDGIGDDNLDAMIPLLDLCNHKRGSNEKSNVSYQREEATAQNGEDDKAYIVVTAKRDLEPGSVLGITYGAKSNSVLLSRYGFTISDNNEPDGSSNDVVEFSPKNDGNIVELRRGPKSYTYGCFIKALEQFYDDNDTDGSSKYSEDESVDKTANDMEAFLNECDENIDKDDDFGTMCFYDRDNVDFPDNITGQNEDDEIKQEIDAIHKFISSLKDSRERYKLNRFDADDVLESPTLSSKERYCAILIQSEMQTLYLYELAAYLVKSKLTCRLKKNDEACESVNRVKGEIIDRFGRESGEIIINYAMELDEVYFKIRY